MHIGDEDEEEERCGRLPRHLRKNYYGDVTEL